MAKLYKRPGSPKWQAECYVTFPDGHRERVTQTTGILVTGKESKKTAQAVADQIERDLNARGRTKQSPTLSEALVRLTEAAELAGKSWGTVKQICYRGSHLANFFGKDCRLDEITSASCLDYAVLARKDRVANTVEKEFILLGQLFVLADLKKPKFPDLGDKSAKPQRVLEEQEREAFVAAFDPRYVLNVKGYLLAGMRVSEQRKIIRVDWDRRELHIQRTKREVDRKRIAVVPICDELFTALLPRRDMWPVFPSISDRRMDYAIKAAAKKAGIEGHVSANDLRGTFATLLGREGVSDRVVSAIMGNSPAQLQRTYSQTFLPGEHMHEAVACLNSATKVEPSAQDTTHTPPQIH